MTLDPTRARIAPLRATRDRLEAQLADPKTPPYSVAPLSNLQFGFRDRPQVPARRGGRNAWARRQDAISDSREAAGFVLPRHSYRDGNPKGDDLRAAVDVWTEECRAELIRCLERADSETPEGGGRPPTPTSDHPRNSARIVPPSDTDRGHPTNRSQPNQ